MGQDHKASPCQQNRKFYYDKVRIAGRDCRKFKTNTGKSVPFCSTTSYVLVYVVYTKLCNAAENIFQISTEVRVLGSPDTERVCVFRLFNVRSSVHLSVSVCLGVCEHH